MPPWLETIWETAPNSINSRIIYRTAKVHKLQTGEELKELTIRPITSKIKTAPYETTKCLNALLTRLGKSN